MGELSEREREGEPVRVSERKLSVTPREPLVQWFSPTRRAESGGTSERTKPDRSLERDRARKSKSMRQRTS